MAVERRSMVVLLGLAVLLAACSVAVAQDRSFDRGYEFFDYCRSTSNCRRGRDGSAIVQLDQTRSPGFASKNYYLFGSFSADIIFPKGSTAGTIPCFYLIAPHEGYQSTHDEIDMEFLGGNTPWDIIIHTNLISQKQAYLEQFKVWFDPSERYHNYAMQWNPLEVRWLVDGIPIRVTKRKLSQPFPVDEPMRVEGTLWNAEWMQQKWNGQPVAMAYKNFKIDACYSPSSAKGSRPACARGNMPTASWNQKLSVRQLVGMRDIRNKHLKNSWPWTPV